MDQKRIKAMLGNPETRPQALDELGTWVKDTCLLFGCEPSNAYRIAFVFIEGIAASWEERRHDLGIVR